MTLDASEWSIGDVLLCLKDDTVLNGNFNIASYRIGQIVKITGISDNGGYVTTVNVNGGINGWKSDNFEWLDRGNFDDYVRISTL